MFRLAVLLQVYPLTSAIGTQLFVALVVGLLTAFAFQLLLTSLGLAVGISALGLAMRSSSDPDRFSERSADDAAEQAQDGANQSASLGSTIARVGWATGFSILLSFNTVLFAAAFLATRFSQVRDPVSGAIVGLVLWSAYFLILTWVSSSAVTSLLGSVLGSAAFGFRRIVAALNTAFSREATQTLTEAETIDLVRQEMQSALAAANLQETVAAYVQQLAPPMADSSTVEATLSRVIQELAQTEQLPPLQSADRPRLVDLVQQRTGLDVAAAEGVVDRLVSLWQAASAQHSPDLNAQLLQLLQTAPPEALKSDLIHHLEPLLSNIARQPPAENEPEAAGSSPQSIGQTAQKAIHGLKSSLRHPAQLLQSIDSQQLLKAVWQRVDLTDLDVAEIQQQISSLWQQFWDEAPSPSRNIIQTDVAEYLQTVDLQKLKHQDGLAEFRDVLYDPEAAPEQVHRLLSSLQIRDFAAALQQRDDLEAGEIQATIDRLEAVRQEVLATAKAAEIQEQAQYLRQQLENYLDTTPPDDLQEQGLLDWFAALCSQVKFYPEVLIAFLSQGSVLTDFLQQHSELEPEAIDRMVAELQQWGQQAGLAPASSIVDLEEKLFAYLRYTSAKRLTLDAVAHKLQKLLVEMQGLQPQLARSIAEIPALDRQRFSQLLDRRQGLSKKQRRQILKQIDDTWQQFWQDVQAQMQDKPGDEQQDGIESAASTSWLSDRLGHFLLTRLQKLGQQIPDWSGAELDDLQQEIKEFLHDTHMAGWVMRQQLHRLNWDLLAERLQALSLSHGQTQQILRWLRLLLHPWLKLPRRWVGRSALAQVNQPIKAAQQQAQTALSSVFNYIASALDTVNPLPIQHLQSGMAAISEAGFEKLPETVQSLISELQMTDLRHLSVDALKEQLGKLSQNALMTLAQSQKDASGAAQTYLLAQAEGLRDRLLQQVEQVQLEAQQRIDRLKQEAQQRISDTRKAAAAAAWWLAGTALTSAISAALSGLLAARL